MTTTREQHRQNKHLTFKANSGVGRHGWLRLTPAYGVRLVREKVSHLPAGSVITDPFSGTGTTPLAAAEMGHLGQSVDVNPFLIWLAETKIHHYSPSELAAAQVQIPSVVSAAGQLAGKSGLWHPNLFKIEKWWSAAALNALSGIRQAIDEVEVPAAVRSLYEIALCRTLISQSNAAFNHQSMSFKDTTESLGLFEVDDAADTLAAFESESRAIVASAQTDLPGKARIVHGDSRSTPDVEQCDLLLTSPPYVNRMSYIRELRPYMYWLRYLDAASDAGDLDWLAIGGTWGTATSKLNTWQAEGTTPVDDHLEQVCQAIAADGGKNGPLLANYVRKYFHDMWAHFQAYAPVVKPGGAASYIVGNSTFYGHVVPAQDWYAAMLKSLGFERVEVEVIRKRNSNKALFEYDVRGVRA